MFGRNQKKILYVLILIFPVYFFFVRFASAPAIKFKVASLLSSPIRILSFPLQEAKKILFYHSIYNEYRRLKKEVNTLRSRMHGFDEVLLENNRLEDLLKLKRNLLYPSVAANVIGRDPALWRSTLMIDKGAKHGIKPGMSVVNAFGVVGKIAEVADEKSKVLLITDPQFSVAALIKEPRETALVSGSLQGNCRIRYINEDAEILPGDAVITSKLSTSFPEGLMIGEIVEVNRTASGTSQEGTVKPAVSLSQIEEVLVILNEAEM